MSRPCKRNKSTGHHTQFICAYADTLAAYPFTFAHLRTHSLPALSLIHFITLFAFELEYRPSSTHRAPPSPKSHHPFLPSFCQTQRLRIQPSSFFVATSFPCNSTLDSNFPGFYYSLFFLLVCWRRDYSATPSLSVPLSFAGFLLRNGISFCTISNHTCIQHSLETNITTLKFNIRRPSHIPCATLDCCPAYFANW